MSEPSQRVQERVVAQVMSDLRPSAALVHAKIAFAASLGALLSLVVCGQFGFALSPLADVVGMQLMVHMSEYTCALACGGIFAVLPVGLLRLICHPLQFRVIVRQWWVLPAFWFASIGAVLVWHGTHGRSWIEFGVWVSGALAVYTALAAVLDRMPAWSAARRFDFPQ